MKKTIRALVICLALILCLTPVLMACDSADPEGGNDVTNNENAGNDAASVEGRRIATCTSFDKSHKVRMYQIEETNGAEKVKCALILYTADGTALDSVTFDVKVNGEDAKFECFHKATWHDDKVEIIVRDHDNAETTYTLKYSK